MIPVVPELFTHVLAEFDRFDPLISALRLDSGRLKCTCLAVSRKWLALGTSAGGLHLIQRDGWKQRLILTHKEGSLTHVACCPHDEDFIAVATSEGLVVIWELQVERRGHPERAGVSWEHRGQAITALCWDTATLRVFIGDAAGKVSFVRAGTSKPGKGSSFVIFPAQTIMTVDSRVVQLGYLEGHLLVSSLSRCYLCDTEREKFWRVGNKERDGEYGACYLPQQQTGSRTPGTANTHLVYCARPGSRVWEANFSGEVLSTHQFKQLLACPPLPLVSCKNEPHYISGQKSPQSLAFRRLLHLSDHNLLTWTDSAIYIFTPHSGQVLLWTKMKDIVDMAVFRNELFCLHGDGHLSHLLLMPVERCVERLMKRENWTLAASVCCMFQHTIVTCRARKIIPIDRLEHLKAQLNSTSQQELIGQLEEVISKLEPMDSACSSRRSSISSHESFSVLDCGIYRVISRRGSQSDEDTSSLINQSLLEEERMKEFNFAQEEEQVEPDPQSCARVEGDKSDLGLQFHLPLSFRPKPPLIALQAVKDSVSSFMKKTTEKINNLQMNSDLWTRPDHRDGGQEEIAPSVTSCINEVDNEETVEQAENELHELRAATEKAILQIQDPLVLLDLRSLTEVLLEWVPILERVLGQEKPSSSEKQNGEIKEEKKSLEVEDKDSDSQPSCAVPRDDSGVECQSEFEDDSNHVEDESLTESTLSSTALAAASSVALVAPVEFTLPSDLQDDLSHLACLYLDLGCPSGAGDGGLERVCVFLRRYFFLLDKEKVRKMCTLRYREQPDILNTYIACMLEFTQASKVVEIIQKGDLLKSLRSLRELQPWNAPVLLTHLYRLYEKHGEMAVRAYPQFYPTILPSDIIAMVQPSHFLPYLDNLVQSQAEEQRLSFLGSLLQPETLRHVWLALALSHDAPQKDDTLTAEGNPKWHSHYFCWGYGRLLSLLISLPADLDSKQKMMESCRLHGYWTGYLYLCKELRRRAEAFSAICVLDDMSLLEEPNGIVPETMEEWMFLIQLCQQRNSTSPSLLSTDTTTCPSMPSTVNGTGADSDVDNTNNKDGDTGPVDPIGGSADWSSRITVEKLVLCLARIVGPDQALVALQEHGLHLELNTHSTLVCELLRVAEKRQRALIQTMLERCDRFLWSQQA
ncbi:Hermansky-Pudlak syndrome 5 protein isoform X1 [Tachysurus fulvidraco]|uniref:Hermansky-Pudlak syndrome 5 protein isoform X1 n=1 Tax=Tachysurus fulvidraco TaxID=1234273 RepID=UPI001FED2EC5|nr:Hermansky-Pudlak syndrome 5 protein isoform X1 [Tachysurus fulvidraco]XP_047675394.1 Hermansky-Pudlak syndrome 5 protein isoform X1 [Tachysurus fulvidraco]XP_047675395.1 Hermansky-Pudlak syndrome 5 protein isoform X1 [Tachysurus fulvidraco]XP_047675396.1 Hermansky-Pudlak syndrome 5 protein isoform X1 [Tachysurus fulvidraco]